MARKDLSPREEQIVELCVKGMTNDGIANQLGLSVGTVNTYWLRIKMKVGGQGRTDTVVRIIKERAETALRQSNEDRSLLADIVAQRESELLELRSALALLHLAMEQIKSTVWATDVDLVIKIIANGEYPSMHCGVLWEVGKSVYEVFKTNDTEDIAIAAHLETLAGKASEVRLKGEFEGMHLRVLPLKDEGGEIIGCISILNIVGP